MYARRRGWFVFVSLALLSCQLAFPILVYGQAWIPPKHTGTVSLAYKNLYVHDHLTKTGKRIDRGQIRHNVLAMDLDYGVTRRLALNVGVPLTFGKYTGATPHRDPGQVKYLDDGKYHGGFQDFRLGGRYSLVRYGPVVVTPFIEGIVPSHHYETFAHTAIGRDLREFLVGTYVGRDLEPVLPNAYFQARVSYALVKRVLGMSHNRTNIYAELGYGLTERVALSGLASFQKHHGGLDFDDSKPALEQFTLEQYHHHDQLFRADSLDVGGGVSFVVNRSTSVFATLRSEERRVGKECRL